MKTSIKGHSNLTAFDTALARYGNLDGLGALLFDNPQLLTAQGVLSAETYVVDEVATPAYSTPEPETVAVTEQAAHEVDYVSGSGQTAFDVALMQYGAVGGIAQLLSDNDLIARDGELKGYRQPHRIRNSYAANARMKPLMNKIKPSTGAIHVGDMWVDESGENWTTDDGQNYAT